MQKDIPANVDIDHFLQLERPCATAAEHGARVEQLFREHNESLLRFLRARLHSPDEAREVAQEAYVQMLGLDNPAAPGFMQNFLFRTAATIATDRRNCAAAHRREEQLVFFADAPARQRDMGAAMRAKQQLERVNAALGELPPSCRRAFILVRCEGMNCDAAAAELGLQPRQVRRFVQRAFAICQRALRN